MRSASLPVSSDTISLVNLNAGHQHLGKIERDGDIKAGKAPYQYGF